MSVLREALALSIVVLAGCGGSDTSDVGSDASSTGSDGSILLPTGDGATNTGDDTTGGDDAGDGVPMVGPDGGLIVPIDDAGTEADGSRGGVTTPRGTDGGADQIACGTTPCDSKTQVCCASGRTPACIKTGGMCTGAAFACSGTNSCSTGVCCEELTGRTAASKCEATCPMGSLQLCTTNADCTGADEICRRATGGYNVCVREVVRDAGPTFPMRDGGPTRFNDGG